eukprot:CAMPEP_0206434244 /NCGR_PEP_ID=MMETSP0324_2-20121206/9039_1 /ASSEMBLY_ACC=CAM_ASM_000836 /TAXON_ID=2866 /ORGANISM="Crypthecodinium cohnii, Strain Seligo" /LENGTH=716 /DNA_ID=CAMNT_0053900715 /DNA_START=65 /DNA_END=2215 /DNA_ORIENTATION=+
MKGLVHRVGLRAELSLHQGPLLVRAATAGGLPLSRRRHQARLTSTSTSSSTPDVAKSEVPRAPLASTPSVVGPQPTAAQENSQKERRTPYCLDLPGLIEVLKQELPAQPVRGAPINEEVKERVSEVLRNTKLNPKEWKQHAVFRHGRYTRNIVGYSPGQFVALLLCWERGQQSPIHDHTGAHCFVKMLQGRLKEEQFAWTDDGRANPQAINVGFMETSVPAANVGFAHDDTGLHRISNPDLEEAAVSLHIYSPPFEDCQVFPPTGAEPKRVPMVSINALGYKALQPPSNGPPPSSVRDLCETLKSIGGSFTTASPTEPDPNVVLDALTRTELSAMEWATLASPAYFSEFHVGKNLIRTDEHFSVMVFCWGPGQTVPAHHIGRDRFEWVKVLHGDLKFQEHSQGLFLSEVEATTNLSEGSSSYRCECSARLHSYENASLEKPAVSVHVFSPPLTQFTFRSKNGLIRQDVPMLLGSIHGGGTLLPNVPKTEAISPQPEKQAAANTLSDAATQASADSTAAEMATRGAEVSGTPPDPVRSLLRTTGRKYLSFRGLTNILDEEMHDPNFTDEAAMSLLKKAVFNAEEWRALLDNASDDEGPGPQTVTLRQCDDYSMTLSFWDNRKQASFSGEPGCKSFTLVLEGELEERTYAIDVEEVNGHVRNGHAGVHHSPAQRQRKLLRVTTLKEDSVAFSAGYEEQQLRCESDAPAVSLSIFFKSK